LRSSLQRELNDFFGKVNGSDFSIQHVTKGAFSQARAKMNYTAFVEVSNSSVDFFYNNTPYRTWDKHRILACDGSTLMLPNSLDIQSQFPLKGFGKNADSQRSLAKISLIYDVLNLTTLNAKIDTFETHETQLLKQQLEEVTFIKNDILLLDRGYPSFGLLYELQARNIDFCIRLKDNWWTEINTMLANDETDKTVTFTLNKKDHHLLAKYNSNVDKITVRIVVIELENGIKEILCTSLLDKVEYTLIDLKQLYHLRWSIEEAYKLFKSRTDLESFSGLTALSVKQDFYAGILAMNMCAILGFPIEEIVRKEYKQSKTGQEKSTNKTNIIAMFTKSLVGIFIKNKIKKFLMAFDKILLKTTELVRRNRSNPRNHKQKKQKSMNYKQL
jgi:hypothetical protein